MKNREELELLVLKHLVSSPKAINQAISMDIREDHFHHAEPSTNQPYHAYLFNVIKFYFDESNGSLLTGTVLENRLIRNKIPDNHKKNILMVWERSQEEDYNENETYDLLIQLKQNQAMILLQDLHKKGHEVMGENGVQASVDYIQDMVAQIQGELHVLENNRQSVDIADSAEYFAAEYKKRLENPDKYKGVVCGCSTIDDKTFGFFPGQIITLMAPSSGGKSVQLLNWASYAHLIGRKNVLYFSFEMDLWLCMLRHISLILEIPYANLKGLKYRDVELESIIEKIMNLKDGSYFEYDVNMEDPTPEYVDTRIRELACTKGKPDLVVCDYVGNMHSRSSRASATHWEKNGDAAVGLFALAKKYGIPILTAQQVTKEAIKENRKQKETGKSSAFYQDSISGDARLTHLSTYVIGMEPDKENNLMTYYPVKMRDAQFDPFHARVDVTCNKIYELSPDEENEFRKDNQVEDAEGKRKHPTASQTPSGETVIEWGGVANTYTPEDLEMEPVDDWVTSLNEEL